MLSVSIGSPNPSGGLFLSPDQKGGEKKEIPPPLSYLEDRLEKFIKPII
jgi:hypothetical protein